MTIPHPKHSLAVLYSGGLDSAILLAHLVRQGHHVQPLYVDCELVWQAEELRHARRFLATLDSPSVAELVVLRLPLADLYDGHWSITGQGVPTADDPDESVYLPGRNPLLMIKAHVWCGLHGVNQLALGALKTNPFADATDTFFQQFEAAMSQAVSNSVRIVRPLAEFDKRQAMELGRHAPLECTFSCLAPHKGWHCGRCNKCAERRRAFALAGLTDPTAYSFSQPSLAL